MKYHVPVLLNESINGLSIKPEGTYVDLTFGGGGHSKLILEKLNDKGRLISFDIDSEAIRLNKLVRKNFELKVVNVSNEESKMCWIKNFIEKEKGSGLVYTGTRTDTDKYASWLQFNNIKA